jgi:hypothetical protein
LSVQEQQRMEAAADLAGTLQFAASQRRQMHMDMQTTIQRSLSDWINAVRGIGVGMFLAGLAFVLLWMGLRYVTGWWRGTPRPVPFEHIFAASLLLVLTLPLAERVKAEEIDIAHPFMPFTLRSWYLPASVPHVLSGGDIASPPVASTPAPFPGPGVTPLDMEALYAGIAHRVDSVLQLRLGSIDSIQIARFWAIQTGIANLLDDSLVIRAEAAAQQQSGGSR